MKKYKEVFGFIPKEIEKIEKLGQNWFQSEYVIQNLDGIGTHTVWK